MPNPTVTTLFSNPDPTTEVSTPTELVALLNDLVTSAIEGAYTPYVTGASTPAVADQDKAWVQTDGAGRPIATKLFYNGNWRRVYNGATDEVKIFIGDPAVHFDGTGLGIVGGEWDGWALCNGDNGTPQWSNAFIVGGQMDNIGITGYNSGWQTNLTGTALKSGGNAQHTLVNNNLPHISVQLNGKNIYDDGASHAGDERAIVTAKYDSTSATKTVTLQDIGADPTGSPAVPQIPIPITPPFVVCAFCRFVGYA